MKTRLKSNKGERLHYTPMKVSHLLENLLQGLSHFIQSSPHLLISGCFSLNFLLLCCEVFQGSFYELKLHLLNLDHVPDTLPRSSCILFHSVACFSLLFMILLEGLTDFLIRCQIKMVTQPPSAAEEARIPYIQLLQPARQRPQERNTWEWVCLLCKLFLTALLWLFLSFLCLLSYQSNCFSLKKQNSLKIKISHYYC